MVKSGYYLSAHSDTFCFARTGTRSVNLVTEDSLARNIREIETELEKFGLKKKRFRWMIPSYEHYNQFSADMLRKLGYELVNPTEGLVTGLDWMGPESPAYRSA